MSDIIHLYDKLLVKLSENKREEIREKVFEKFSIESYNGRYYISYNVYDGLHDSQIASLFNISFRRYKSIATKHKGSIDYYNADDIIFESEKDATDFLIELGDFIYE